MDKRIENMVRFPEVTEVKFDKENKRWLAKVKDGEDFKSDWLIWQAFSHGKIFS